ncbi:MAG: hypothetical protein ABIW32_05340 [Terrimesophilobacter sp.]
MPIPTYKNDPSGNAVEAAMIGPMKMALRQSITPRLPEAQFAEGARPKECWQALTYLTCDSRSVLTLPTEVPLRG